jgi:hypothetical protein
MGATATFWDNAGTESFFSVMKDNFCHQYHFSTRQQSRASAAKFIEWFHCHYRRPCHHEGALPPGDVMRLKLNPVVEIVLPAAN